MKNIKIKDKEFELFIEAEKIENSIDRVADRINVDLKDKTLFYSCFERGIYVCCRFIEENRYSM